MPAPLFSVIASAGRNDGSGRGSYLRSMDALDPAEQKVFEADDGAF